MVIHFLREVIGVGFSIFWLFVFALLALVDEVGFQIGRARSRAATPLDIQTDGVSTLTTGMLGLVAFTLAVTIGIAQDRFEARRNATLDEANKIGTAWRSTGLAGASGKPIAELIEEYARAHQHAEEHDLAGHTRAGAGNGGGLGLDIRVLAQRHVRRQPGSAVFDG